MADTFSCEDARKLLKNKVVFILGDSNLRATYKDMVLLLNRNEILGLSGLRERGEITFEGDTRINYEGLTKGRQYVEGRKFEKHDVEIEYHFITKCFTPEIVTFLRRMKNGEMKTPDVMIMNSCIWDISRWGPNGVSMFKENMLKLMNLLDECLPKHTLFIWASTLPVSKTVRGGLLIKQLDFMEGLLRFQVMEANLFCRDLVVKHGYDILDAHYYLRMQIHRRLKDGIHYEPLPVRFITNLLLTHISLSWEVPLPGNTTGIALERVIKEGVLCTSEKVNLPKVPECLRRPAETRTNDEPAAAVAKNSGKSRGRNQFRGKFSKAGSSRQHHKAPPVWQNDSTWQTNENTWMWQQKHSQLQPQQQPRFQQSNDYWQENLPGQWQGYEKDFDRNYYVNFNRPYSGPIRKQNKGSKNRTRPY